MSDSSIEERLRRIARRQGLSPEAHLDPRPRTEEQLPEREPEFAGYAAEPSPTDILRNNLIQVVASTRSDRSSAGDGP